MKIQQFNSMILFLYSYMQRMFLLRKADLEAIKLVYRKKHCFHHLHKGYKYLIHLMIKEFQRNSNLDIRMEYFNILRGNNDSKN